MLEASNFLEHVLHIRLLLDGDAIYGPFIRNGEVVTGVHLSQFDLTTFEIVSRVL